MGVKNIAVVGFGQIGKRHVEVIEKNSKLQIHSIVDNEPNKIAKLKYPSYLSLNELLESDEDLPDLISVCTPNYLHLDNAEQIVSKGIKLLIEKPLAIEYSDASRFNDKWGKNGQAFTVTQNRYSPTIQLLKDIIEQGKIGTVTNIQVNCFWNRNKAYYKESNWKGSIEKDGGVLFTQFSHFIDLLVWLFGGIQALYSRTENYLHRQITEFDDSGIIAFTTSEGALGSIHYSTAAFQKNMESRIVLLGTEGSICIAGQYMNEIAWVSPVSLSENVHNQANSSNNYGNYQGSAANHHLLYEDLANNWNQPEKITTSNIEDAAKVVEFIEQVHKLADQ